MIGRQATRYVRCLGFLSIVGLSLVGCIHEDSAALSEIYKAQDAVSAAQKAGAAERYPDEYAELEKRYLMSRGVYYSCDEAKALQMAQALISDANALASKAPVPSAAANQTLSVTLSGPTSGLINDLIMFEATGSAASGDNDLQFDWDFGDGKRLAGTSMRAPHRYNVPGTYTVNVTAADAQGAQGMAAHQIVIGRKEVLSTQILFDFDSDTLQATAEEALMPLVDELQEQSQWTATIVGYTDTTGPEAYNIALSQRRAQAVGDVFTDHGIASERLRLEGRGPDDPVADNATREGRQQNRRVEVTVSPLAAQ